LGQCSTCLAIDDELNILPITSHIKEIKEVKLPGQGTGEDGEETKIEDLYLTKEQKDLKDLKQ
jgi:N-acetyltransferase 10